MAQETMTQSEAAESRRFVASRLTNGNFLFPTVITVTPIQVVKRKRSWLSSDEESINIRHVSSVRIKTGVLFSDIWIESSGGTNQIFSHGHYRWHAREIKRLIEDHQRHRRPAPGAVQVPRTSGGRPDGGARGGGAVEQAASTAATTNRPARRNVIESNILARKGT